MSNSVKFAYNWPKVFLFGDSITQRSFSPDGCWGSCLADFLIRRCDVIARGFSGYNTRGCKCILPNLLNKENAKDIVAMTLFLGANDSTHAEIGENQHVPVEEFGQNLKDMVNHGLSVGLRRDQIILITPPALGQIGYDAHCVESGKALGCRTNKLAGIHASECCKVATEMGTSLVDLHSEMMKNQDFESYLIDGLHLSKSGSILLFNLLQPIISRLTSDIPEMLYPEWSEIDNKDVESAKQSIKDKGWL